MTRSPLILLALSLTLSACAVGPKYRRPEVATGVAFKEQGDWKPSAPADALEHGPWWEVFSDPVLDGLERQIEISNQTLKSAQDQYREAQALVDEDRSSFWPTLGISASGARGQQGAYPPSNGVSAGASGSWNIDLWGQIRRQVESARASAQSGAAAVESARLSAQATLAIDYFELRAQDSLKQILDDTVADEQKSLSITESRYKFGVTAKADVVTAQTQLLSSQAQQVSAGIQRAQLEHAIAVLIGKLPSEFSLEPAPLTEDVPTAPAGMPSTLLERRPDIAEAERSVAAANASIGVAMSAFFPSLTLSGSVSYSRPSFADLISVPDRIWSVGPALAETLFSGGARRAAVRRARATYDASVDAYRQTVLTGFQSVEDNLVSLRVLEQQAGIETQAVAAAKEAETLTLNQYKAGTVPYTSVITSQTTTLASQQTELTVRMSRLAASIALIEAVGGGWDASQLSSDQPSAPPPSENAPR